MKEKTVKFSFKARRPGTGGFRKRLTKRRKYTKNGIVIFRQLKCKKCGKFLKMKNREYFTLKNGIGNRLILCEECKREYKRRMFNIIYKTRIK